MVICAWVLGCAARTISPRDLGPVSDGALVTDATGYVAQRVVGSARPIQYRFTVISRFQNRSAAAVYLARCYPDSPQPIYGIGAADSSAVASAYEPFRACVGHESQFEVLPGTARVDTLHVQGPNVFDGVRQRALGATSGVFRLKFFVSSARGYRVPGARDTLVVSNAFIVRTSDQVAP